MITNETVIKTINVNCFIFFSSFNIQKYMKIGINNILINIIESIYAKYLFSENILIKSKNNQKGFTYV